MSPRVFATFADLAARRLVERPIAAVLEVGMTAKTLLAIATFAGARKVALNMRFDNPASDRDQIERVIGNCNQLEFADESFDCVVSSSTLEHDKYFWRSTAEIRRVLKPGGYFIVGVPIYMTLWIDRAFTTLTYARHGLGYNADFYRFSEQAVRELFFEGYAAVTDEVIVRRYPNPYLVAAGRK